MTLGLLVWTALMLTLSLGLRIVVERKRRAQGYVRARTDEHQALLDALEDWFTSDDVRRALYRSGWTKPEYLAEFRRRMGGLPYEKLEEATDALLKDRHVRMMVARHMNKSGRASKPEVMRALRRDD